MTATVAVSDPRKACLYWHSHRPAALTRSLSKLPYRDEQYAAYLELFRSSLAKAGVAAGMCKRLMDTLNFIKPYVVTRSDAAKPATCPYMAAAAAASGAAAGGAAVGSAAAAADGGQPAAAGAGKCPHAAAAAAALAAGNNAAHVALH